MFGNLARMPTQPDDPPEANTGTDLFTKADPVAPQSFLPNNDNSTFGSHPPVGGNPTAAKDDLFGPPPL